jgi:hypothetical protein
MVIMPIPVAMTVTLVPWTFALMVFVFLSRQAQVPLAMTIAIYVQMTFVTGKAFATIALPHHAMMATTATLISAFRLPAVSILSIATIITPVAMMATPAPLISAHPLVSAITLR